MSNEKIFSKRTPIYRDAGFLFNNIAEAEQAFKKEGDEPQSAGRFIYTRYGNPTVVATEVAIAKLEGSKWALLTASGMAAVDVALSIFQEDGDERPCLFFSELDGGAITPMFSGLVRALSSSRL
jgi:O-acetylhomoserine/O-acetylserine sulfhydrylase-like pyridoxal-dependent enzyme